MTRGIIDTDITAVLVSPDKRVREASDILSRLYRTILANRSLGWQKWNTLLTNYLDRVYNGELVSIDKITNDRGNIRKALGAPTMTWPTFCKGIDIFAPHKAEFWVGLEMADDKELFAAVNVLQVDPDGSPGKLTQIFRNLSTQAGKDYRDLSDEIDAYLNNPNYRVKTHGRQRGNDKGNMKREVVRDDITFEVLKKGLRALDPKVTHFGIVLWWDEKRFTTHRLHVNTPT